MTDQAEVKRAWVINLHAIAGLSLVAHVVAWQWGFSVCKLLVPSNCQATMNTTSINVPTDLSHTAICGCPLNLFISAAGCPDSKDAQTAACTSMSVRQRKLVAGHGLLSGSTRPSVQGPHA